MKKTEFSSALLRERYIKFTHPSGLPIYVFPKKMTTTFAYFAVRYGSQNCEWVDASGNPMRDPDGVAHFLEHKLFENEDGSDAFARFSELGADANAYTSYDRTAYLCSCTENVEDVLAELLHFVTHPHFTDASVKKEQGIIAEEIRMYEDNPWERCYQNLLKLLYRKHPVRKNICGTQSSIRKITPELLYACYNRFYAPENMVLIVCGDVAPETVLAVVDRALPQEFLLRRATGLRVPRETGAVAGSYAEISMPISKPIYAIGIKDGVLGGTPNERLRLELCHAMLDEILFSRSGHFYNDLFERGILTPSYSSGYSVGDGFSFYSLEGEADDPQAVLDELKSYLASVCKNGIADEDFERARRVLYADEVCTYDSTEEIATRLLTFAFEGTELFSCPALLQKISKKELEELLRATVFENRFSLSVVLPSESH
ncbi:MAG: insulinase family protein [Ruminococcaceae bacterium]|nr:insulinase family protein [Oscillospiraceae bacterium]